MSYDASLGGGGWTVNDIKAPTPGAPTYVAGAAGYPAGATPVAATSAVANAAATATLPAAAGKTTYLTSVQVTGQGATAAAAGSLTITGLLGGTKVDFFQIPAGAGAAAMVPLTINFNPPLPASAANTAIAAQITAFGAGNIAEAVSVQGFQA